MVLGPILNEHLRSVDRVINHDETDSEGQPVDTGPVGGGPPEPDTGEAGSDAGVQGVGDQGVGDQGVGVPSVGNPGVGVPGAGVRPVQRRRSLNSEPKPTLTSPLLSGRSLQPVRQNRSWVRRHIRLVIAVAVLVVIAVGVVVAKNLAESAADTLMARRAVEIEELLGDAEPSDLMAFGAAVETPGSLAQQVRDTDGFVNVTATADLAFIRFQPSGWWSGFTERCLVASVRPDSVTVETPKTACVRIETPPRG